MALRLKLPIGVDLFEKLRRSDYYYVDKSLFIKELLNNRGEVNLFTRPRRFGKSLNMSMLKAFFEIGTDPSLFEGLAISQDRSLCEKYMGRFPVIFLSLKGVEGTSFSDAQDMMSMVIADECRRLSYLLKSDRVEQTDQDIMERLTGRRGDSVELRSSLAVLLRMLHSHHGRQVILLIDEYDVPLDKANAGGYYRQMADFLRAFFGAAFKTNADLYFAVVTGCLRISKESIFTGVNNLKTDTISDDRYDEYFGFTDEDVRRILADYGLESARDKIREWYDGYRFGDREIYCPWDVLNYCDRLMQRPDAEPELYWDNTSSNELVKRFIELADVTTRNEIEELIAGHSVKKKLIGNLTYEELEEDRDHLWSVLYLTGYLTAEKNSRVSDDGKISLVIPNREIREIFVSKIQKWFSESRAVSGFADLYEDVWACNAQGLQEKIREILLDTISYFDYHENYYHAFMAGLLMNRCVRIKSNYESGTGRSGLVVEDDRGRRAVVIETKYSARYDDMEADCEKALRQIEDRQYAWPYLKRKYCVIIYGIAFSGKDCQVKGRILKPETGNQMKGTTEIIQIDRKDEE